MNNKQLNALLVLLGLYVVGLTISNIIAGIKLITIFGLVMPSAVLAYAFLTFPITDIVGELYGHKKGRLFVIIGFLTQLVMLGLIFIGKILPPLAPEMQELYNKTFSLSFRIVLASLLSFLASQNLDIFLYDFWGRLTKGKYIFIRNNGSTMISQFVDTLVFITVAFFGVVEFKIFVSMLIGQYIVKLVIAAVDTPFVYTGIHLIKKYTKAKSVFE